MWIWLTRSLSLFSFPVAIHSVMKVFWQAQAEKLGFADTREGEVVHSKYFPGVRWPYRSFLLTKRVHLSLLWGGYFLMPRCLLFLYFPSTLNFCSGLASEPIGVIVGISFSSAQQCILFGLQQQWLSFGASPSEDSCCIFCHTDESQGAEAPLLHQSPPLRGCGHWALALITLVT